MEDILRCSVADLAVIFRQALVALIPTADRLLLEWLDAQKQHRDWERIAESLFDACVRGPLDADVGRRDGEFPLVRYDIDADSYDTFSWIGVRSRRLARPAPLIRFVTVEEPFDTVQVAILDAFGRTPLTRVLVPFDEAEFIFVRRSKAEPDAEIREIEACE